VNTAPTLCVSAELKNLGFVRDYVAQRAAILGVDQDALYDVILAVDEAVTNIVVHGYQGQAGNIEITVRRVGDALVVRLEDSAVPFNPHCVPPPDLSLSLEERPIGGMGVYMMKRLVDRVIHRLSPQGGNELTLVKNRIFRPTLPSRREEDTNDHHHNTGSGQRAGDRLEH
jgi:serine/threonine-protein kinase RsbW